MKAKAQTEAQGSEGRFAYEGLDRVMHEKARLGVLSSLVAHPKGLAFGDLKQLCALTDGNLSRHLQVLQEAGLVEITKSFENNRPQTTCRLTRSGRKRFLDYLALLEQVVRDAAKTAEYNQAAEGFAQRLISLEAQVDDQKKQLLDATTNADENPPGGRCLGCNSGRRCGHYLVSRGDGWQWLAFPDGNHRREGGRNLGAVALCKNPAVANFRTVGMH